MPKLGTDLSVADEHLRAVLALYHRAAEQPLQLLDEASLRVLLGDIGFEIGRDDPVSSEVLRAAGEWERTYLFFITDHDMSTRKF